MKIARVAAATHRLCRSAGRPIVLVPTMGALHAGHTALIDRARAVAGPGGFVVVSIFVNPTQFSPGEDLSRYPRPFQADRKLCAARGVDLLFHPTVAEIYAPDASTLVEESAVSRPLCGATRPAHFRGVCTVVLKLFQIVAPHAAVFGLKDYQQCAVVRRMVRDLHLPVRIIAVPTVREPDGLALSSRNRYLSVEERRQAPVLRRALLAARDAWRSGEMSTSRLRKLLAHEIAKAPLARIDYAEVVDGTSLQPIEAATRGTLLAVAVFFGKTRLIDNLVLS